MWIHVNVFVNAIKHRVAPFFWEAKHHPCFEETRKGKNETAKKPFTARRDTPVAAL